MGPIHSITFSCLVYATGSAALRVSGAPTEALSSTEPREAPAELEEVVVGESAAPTAEAVVHPCSEETMASESGQPKVRVEASSEALPDSREVKIIFTGGKLMFLTFPSFPLPSFAMSVGKRTAP